MAEMHVEHLRLQRVFDVRRGALSKTSVTNISFETTDGRRCLSVQLPGHPRLEAGDPIAAVLTRAGHWQTLRGWKNLATHEISIGGQLDGVDALRMAIVTAFIFAMRPTTGPGRTLADLALGACGLMAAALARQQWQGWQARRLPENL